MPQASLITDYLCVLSAQLPAPLVEEPQVIVAAFTRLSPARHAARRLLATGPVVGGCWAAALITGRAWTWPVPATVLLLIGVVLITVIGLLAAAAFGRRYLSA